MNRINVEEVKELLKLREGVVYKVYKDSLGKLTAGIGHLLTPAELKQYKLGDKVSVEQVDKWFDEDVQRFLKLTAKQLDEIGIVEGFTYFSTVLVSVNYQLGNFSSVFPQTWGKLVKGDYEGAIKGVQSSLWAKQTPVRVKDFVEAIEKLRDNKGK